MADEFPAPVAALPQVRLRRYDVELAFKLSGAQPCWRVLDTFEAESTRAALDAHLRGESPLSAAGTYRVTEHGQYGITQRYVVEPVLSVSDYEEPEPEPGETPSGGGGPS